MEVPHGGSGALTVALALALGMLAQTVARHLRVPGIVLLLATGVLVGPDVLGVVDPAELGGGLQTLVGFAVAIILFEGGLSLNLVELRRQARSVRRLVTVGALVTTLGGALAARFILGWSWELSVLFGTLVIVTGPTVINPLLRRIRVDRRVATVLEAEGVFGDAIGAIVAVFALEVVLSPGRDSFAHALGDFAARFAVGGVLGLLLALLVVALIKVDWLVPSGLENVFVFSFVVLLYQASDALMAESGIVAVIVCGATVANVRGRALEHLREFKEQLTILLIGLLFVLLAADVRLDVVRSLGWPGLLTVLVLMFVVRPATVTVSTAGTTLSWRHRAFIAWLAPRGIVAAAVSSLFAISLDQAGIEGGRELRALVFLVIAVTVLVEGLSGGLVARLLGIRPKPPSGFVILGANPLGLALGTACAQAGKEITFIDSNPENCKRAQEAGHRVLYGNGLDESVLRRARLEDREGCVGLTPNENINFSFARRVHLELKVQRVWVGLLKGRRKVTVEMVERMGGKVLFGEPRDLDHWTLRFGRERAWVEEWECVDPAGDSFRPTHLENAKSYLPFALIHKGSLSLIDTSTKAELGDRVLLALHQEREEQARDQLRAAGWAPVAAREEPEE